MDLTEFDGVLHALRLRSLASPAQISEHLRLDELSVVAILSDASARGLVVERSGRLAGWTLTPQGRLAGESALSTQLDALGARSALVSVYTQFQSLNAQFLTACTRWQLRVDNEGVETINDHSDDAYDAAVTAELAQIHVVLCENVLEPAASAVIRFNGYRARFEHALGRLCENDVDWFTKPLIDSYHTVWFELHEDLLATLGRSRSAERGEHKET